MLGRMSKGHGAAQRFVLDRLGEEQGRKPWHRWVPVTTIARDRAGRQPTTAEAESIRRAIRTLARAGKIETKTDSWRGSVLARLPLTAAERKADQAYERKRQRESDAAAFERVATKYGRRGAV
jgi:hypothetical protein